MMGERQPCELDMIRAHIPPHPSGATTDLSANPGNTVDTVTITATNTAGTTAITTVTITQTPNNARPASG
jgi:hypothetical protein